MAITLTEKAAQHILKSIARRGHGVGLRLGVKRVGCSGLAYTFDYADAVAETDRLFEFNQAQVIVDDASIKYLDGSILDFVRDGLKETFRCENPNAKAQCGCGESFSV